MTQQILMFNNVQSVTKERAWTCSWTCTFML